MTLSVEYCGENQVILMCEFVQIYTYSDIQKHHCERAEMGLDDPKLLLGCMSLNGQACAIWVLYFKGEQVLLF